MVTGVRARPDLRQLRRLVPTPVQPLARRAYLQIGPATSRYRMEPSFLVIGGQRCGTTTIFKSLSAHPQVMRPPVEKGTDYYTLHYARGELVPRALPARRAGAAHRRVRTSRWPSRPAPTTCSTRSRSSGSRRTSPTSSWSRCSGTRSSAPTRRTSTSWPGASTPSRTSCGPWSGRTSDWTARPRRWPPISTTRASPTVTMPTNVVGCTPSSCSESSNTSTATRSMSWRASGSSPTRRTSSTAPAIPRSRPLAAA